MSFWNEPKYLHQNCSILLVSKLFTTFWCGDGCSSFVKIRIGKLWIVFFFCFVLFLFVRWSVYLAVDINPIITLICMLHCIVSVSVSKNKYYLNHLSTSLFILFSLYYFPNGQPHTLIIINDIIRWFEQHFVLLISCLCVHSFAFHFQNILLFFFCFFFSLITCFHYFCTVLCHTSLLFSSCLLNYFVCVCGYFFLFCWIIIWSTIIIIYV